MDITISAHAIDKFGRRSGRHDTLATFYYLKEKLNHDDTVEWLTDSSEVRARGFNVTQHQKGDRYGIWLEAGVNEEMCAIVSRDDMVVTILPLHIHDLPAYPLQRDPKMREVRRRRG